MAQQSSWRASASGAVVGNRSTKAPSSRIEDPDIHHDSRSGSSAVVSCLPAVVPLWPRHGAELLPYVPAHSFVLSTSPFCPCKKHRLMFGCKRAGSTASLLTWGALGSAQAGLPITKGPQTQGENGKGGKQGRM